MIPLEYFALLRIIELVTYYYYKLYDLFVQEKSNKIVKEVTETTVLRVLHDIRLGVASYKVISNTIQDHRQHIDVKDIQNEERMLEAESCEKTDSIHHHLALSPCSQYFIILMISSTQHNNTCIYNDEYNDE